MLFLFVYFTGFFCLLFSLHTFYPILALNFHIFNLRRPQNLKLKICHLDLMTALESSPVVTLSICFYFLMSLLLALAQSRRAEYKKESWTNFIYYFVICSSMVRYHKENMHYIWAKGSLTVATNICSTLLHSVCRFKTFSVLKINNKFSKIDEISVFRKLEKNWKKNCEDIVFCQTIETTYNKTS